MRICLVSARSLSEDPRAVAEAESLRVAGHEVVGASRSTTDDSWVKPAAGDQRIARLVGKGAAHGLAAAARQQAADLYRPVSINAVEAAWLAASRVPNATVQVNPTWDRPPVLDLLSLAPTHPELSKPASGREPQLHVPMFTGATRSKRSGTIVVAHRRSDRSPGRYLRSALSSSGVDVVHVEEINWDDIPGSAAAVVVVESPLPALRVRGTNPGIPVVFWVHHGEHHVDANARLQRRYGASVVAMAHSWHLSHRFAGLVDRLPFGAPAELFGGRFVPHDRRRWDVGFVGATSGVGDRYERRRQLLVDLRETLGGDRVEAPTDVAPEEMARLYEGSRVVVDDGLGRHLPITMRVFEATGAGALLVTNEAPGVETLYEPGGEYVAMSSDPVAQVAGLLDAGTETIAEAGYDRAWRDHSYEARVADLFEIIDRSRSEVDLVPPSPLPPQTGLARVVDRFVDAQRVLDLGNGIDRLPGREVWRYAQAEDRAEPGTFHASVVAGGTSEQRERAVAAARIVVVVPPGDPEAIADVVKTIHGKHQRHDYEEGTALSFGTAGYRVSNRPDPD